jgi:hypothetical protein
MLCKTPLIATDDFRVSALLDRDLQKLVNVASLKSRDTTSREPAGHRAHLRQTQIKR